MKFEEQDYQNQCVKNIINALSLFDFKTHSNDSLKQSLEHFYQNEGIVIPNKTLSHNKNLDVLMETGTGKTFTYIKTIFELNKTYNINKFIIFLPRKAIKEGTKQTIETTTSYFKLQYGKTLSVYEYKNKDSISNINNFIRKTEKDISVLILTNSAIDKTDNVLKKSSELLKDNTLLQQIQQIKPVIIIDEPHLLKGNNFIKELAEFKSLYIRFGATFPNEKKDTEHKLSNTVYILDSISSFQQYLVKKIRVNTVSNSNEPIKFLQYDKNKKTILLSYFKNNEEFKKEIRLNEDIGERLGINEYAGIEIIKYKDKKIYLSNNTELSEHKDKYSLTEEEQKNIISSTIESHFNKEEFLFDKGIKTLSLFFIPDINSYTKIKMQFEEEYKKQRQKILNNDNISKKYKEYLQKDYQNENLVVHHEYTSKNDDDEEKVKIILKEKEKLLSFSEPLRFIFSVWALQEGWDNPNIFNIAKLSSSTDTSKRQQVGRGLRICVNQQLERLTYGKLNEDGEEFYNINTLDVIVSSQERDFISSLQEEINKESYKIVDSFNFDDLKNQGSMNQDEAHSFIYYLKSVKIITYNDDLDKYIIKANIHEYMEKNKSRFDFLTEKSFNNVYNIFKPSTNNHHQIENKNKLKPVVNIKKDLYQSFKSLWEVINKKAQIVYSNINEELLIKNIIEEFTKIHIDPIKITITKQSLNPQENRIENEDIITLGNRDFFKNFNNFKDFIFSIAKQEKLPIKFIFKIFNELKAKDKEKISNNPKKAKEELIKIIKDSIHANIIHNVSYNFTSTISISNNNIIPFKEEDIKPIAYTHLGKFIDEQTSPKNYLYDKIVYDSQIEKDAIINDPQNIDSNNIVVFAKLPKISIPTPFKTYNPDFGYLIDTKHGKKLFLIVEAKGYQSEVDIPKEEQLKIDYASKFFKELQNILGKDIKICFKTRLNKQELIDIIQGI
jgi:type III restriction enzyme